MWVVSLRFSVPVECCSIERVFFWYLDWTGGILSLSFALWEKAQQLRRKIRSTHMSEEESAGNGTFSFVVCAAQKWMMMRGKSWGKNENVDVFGIVTLDLLCAALSQQSSVCCEESMTLLEELCSIDPWHSGYYMDQSLCCCLHSTD